MISNSWLRKWLASRDVWIAFDIETKRVLSVTVSTLTWMSMVHQLMTYLLDSKQRKNTKWDLLNQNTYVLERICIQWINHCLEIIFDADFKNTTKIQCYPFFSRWMQNWEWSLMRKRFWIAFEGNRLGKESGTKFVGSKLLCAWTHQ